MKVYVRTTGAFMLANPLTGRYVEENRVNVVPSSSWVQAAVQNGDLEVLGNPLPASASDEEFVQWLTESAGDSELAMESYRSSLEGESEADVPRPTGGKRGSKRAASETE